MRSSIITLAGQAVRFVIQMASLIVMARLLSPSDYGLVGMVLAIVGLASVLGDFGLSLAALQARTLSRGQKTNLFWLNAMLGLGLACIVFLLRHPIASFYHRPRLVSIVAVLSLSFLLNGLTTQFEAELARSLRFSRLAIRDIAAAGLALGVGVAMAAAGCGYWSLVGQQMALVGSSLALSSVLSGWWPGLPDFGAEVRKLVTFGSNSMGVQIASYVSSNVDSVLVGRLWGSVALGFYNRAYTLFGLPLQQLVSPLTRVVLPILSRIDDDEEFLRYCLRAQLMLAYSVIGTLAVGAAVAQPLIATTLGHKWAEVVPIFQVLAIGGVLQAFSYIDYWIFLARGKTDVQVRYSVPCRLLMILFIFIGVHQSTLGAAWGVAAGYFTYWVVSNLFVRPALGINATVLIRDAARATAVFGVAFTVTQVIIRSFPHLGAPPVELAIGLTIFASCIGVIVLLSRSVREDVVTVWRTLMLVRRRGSQHEAGTHEPEPTEAIIVLEGAEDHSVK